MNISKRGIAGYLAVVLTMGLSSATVALADENVGSEPIKQLQEIKIEAPKARLQEVVGPDPELTYKSKVTAKDIKSMNAITMEDTLRYAPNLQIRQRYIGDPNGLVTMNGIGNMQQAGIMVFSDGFPLHFYLQSQWNGSPRWELIAPEEVESTNIIYGAYSALYPGNAMGGVIDIKTRMPEKFEANVETSGFFQDFKLYGTDETYGGFKTHFSVGDKVGKFSYFAFYDHLSSDSQPQTYIAKLGPFSAAAAQPSVTGVFRDSNPQGIDQIIYGSTGSEAIDNNIFKIKGQYEFSSDLIGRVMLAVLDQTKDQTGVENYLLDANGQKVWGSAAGTDYQTQGVAFNVKNSTFSESHIERQDLLLGLGLKGNLPKNWKFDTTFSFYTYPSNVQATSNANREDPLYDGSGVVSDFKDTGWQTFDLLFGNKSFLNDDRLSLFTGYHFEHYALEIDQYNSNNWKEATLDSVKSKNGGETRTHGLFVQGAWKFYPDWTVTAGGRQDWWKAFDGFKTGVDSLADRQFSNFAPKFSLGYAPDKWHFDLSLAQVFRYPIVGELYGDTLFSANATKIANADLKQENAFNKTYMIKRDIEKGWVSLNFFENDIRDLILTQNLSTPPTTTTTFSNVGQVRERGIALDFHQNSFIIPKLDAVFNATYIDTEVLDNPGDQSVIGNELPLIAKWRANTLLTYHVTNNWDVAGGVHFASRAFERLDNTDTRDMFGATTEQLFADIKTSYRLKVQGYDLQGSFGINNINNYQAFDFHPFPQRTYFFQLKGTF